MQGRPLGSYKMTNESLKNAWIEYTIKCEQGVKYQASGGKLVSIPNPIIYTVEDFCVFAGISRETLNEYENIDVFSDTVKEIKGAIFARKQRALVNGEGSTTGLIFDMKANYGINEKNIIEHKGNLNISNLTTEELLMLSELQKKATNEE